ncbi:MAG: ATP-binding protein [Candidatus Hodarchaeota archaeon]
MTENKQDIYRNLQIHLDQFPIGFPPTKTGIELKLLKNVFTEKEAIIATKLRASFDSLEEIHERFNEMEMKHDELEQILDVMVKKGTLKYKVVNGNKMYANIPLIVGIYEHQVNKLTPEFFNDFKEYLLTAFGAELLGTKISQFRTIPIGESITPEHAIADYDEIRKVIENSIEPIGVANCVCRQANEVMGHSCEKTSLKETCLYFNSTGQLFIDQGWARPISKEEALDIVNQSEKDGLTLQAGNTKNPEFICSCCSCCCQILTNLQKIPRPSRVISSNYYAVVDPELCVGCETCLERCQINSIKIVDNKAKVLLKRCIGCGVCVPSCLEDAISLKKKTEISVPPQTLENLYNTILEKKQEIRRK